MFKQYLYKLYLLTLAMPLVSTLIIIGWKRATLAANAQVCGLSAGHGFRVRFYLAAAVDFLRFLHGRYGSPILTRSRDAAKLERLRTGPSLLLTAHFHNWELMGGWLVRQGIPLLSAARPMANGYSQRLLVRLRDRLGQKVLFSEVPRRALRHLQAGGCFGFIWDQRVPASKSQAPLFGRTLAMDPLPRFLFRNTGVPIFFGVLLPGGAFRILQIAGPRIPASPQATTGSEPRSLTHSSPGSFPESLTSSPLLSPPPPPPPPPPLPASSELTHSGSTLGKNRIPSFPYMRQPSNPSLSTPPSFTPPLTNPPPAADRPKDAFGFKKDVGPLPSNGLGEASNPVAHSETVDRIGRRYHRVLECLIRAHPTSWYGLAHRRFLG